VIAEATSEDIPALCELLGELFLQESDFQPDRVKQAAGVRLILKNPEYGKIFVMRRTGAVVGVVNLLHTLNLRHGGRAVILEDMIVRRDFRSQGIATALLAHVLSFAHSLGVVQITLFTDPSNARAIGLYQKLGFTPMGISPMRTGDVSARRPTGGRAREG